MKGRRVDMVTSDEGQYPFPRLEPGDYGKDLEGMWHCCAPVDTGHRITNFYGYLRRHTVTEHEDGTITVSPSILIHSPNLGSWHGYLERGVWRTC